MVGKTVAISLKFSSLEDIGFMRLDIMRVRRNQNFHALRHHAGSKEFFLLLRLKLLR